jgi:zinc transport system ATP-binding protein
MSLITVKNLSVAYGANTILRNVMLTIEPGEIVTIVGPNGSGKTSLLRAIIGALDPSSGEVALKPGLRIGYVPQKLHIDQTLPITVERFMRLTERVSKAVARKRWRPPVCRTFWAARCRAVGGAVSARAAGPRADQQTRCAVTG